MARGSGWQAYQKTRLRRDGALRHGSEETFNLIKSRKRRRDKAIGYAALRAVRARRNNIGIHNFTLGYIFKLALQFIYQSRSGRRRRARERKRGMKRQEKGRGGRQREIKGSSQFAIWTTLGRTLRRGNRHTLM